MVCRPLEGATALHLIHFTVAQERPDAAVRYVLDAAVGEVPVGLGLPDGVQRPDAHRDGGEFPEVGHEVRVRVGGQTTARVGLLLTESVQTILADAPLKECAGVHAGGGMALVENLVATARVVVAVEKVVVSNLVEGSG